MKRHPLQKTACSILLVSSALLGADALAASSTTVTIPITTNRVTYALLANPYSHGGNTVGEVFSTTSGLPGGTTVYKFRVGQ